MSLDTLDILNTHRDDQCELSPSSEEFQIVGGASFFGIFDKAYVSEDRARDGGNVRQKKLKPVIMLSVVPSGLTERSTQIERENGDIYTLFFIGKDDEGVPLLWLF